MHRLFVAIRPPRAMRERLIRLMGGVAHARWQRDDQLHLTLRFIGEVDRHRAEDIVAALGTVHHAGFDLALDGVGQFDRKGRLDTLWVGVSPQDIARALHKKIDQALVRAGLEPETRAYLPHITIARFGRASGSIGGLLDQAGGLSSEPFAMTEFCLYESDMSHEGSIYSIVERYRLD